MRYTINAKTISIATAIAAASLATSNAFARSATKAIAKGVAALSALSAAGILSATMRGPKCSSIHGTDRVQTGMQYVNAR